MKTQEEIKKQHDIKRAEKEAKKKERRDAGLPSESENEEGLEMTNVKDEPVLLGNIKWEPEYGDEEKPEPLHAFEDDPPDSQLLGMEQVLSIFRQMARAPWTYDETDTTFWFYRMTRPFNGIPPICHDLLTIEKFDGTLKIQCLGEDLPPKPFSPHDFDDEIGFLKRHQHNVVSFIQALKKRNQMPNDHPKTIVRYAQFLLNQLLSTGHEGIPSRKLEFLTDQLIYLYTQKPMDSALLKLASSLRIISPEAYDMLRNEDIMTIPTYSLLLTIGCPGNREIRKLTRSGEPEQKENKKPDKPKPSSSAATTPSMPATTGTKKKRPGNMPSEGSAIKRSKKASVVVESAPEESQNVILHEPSIEPQQQTTQQILVPTTTGWYQPEFSVQQPQSQQQSQVIHQAPGQPQYNIIMPQQQHTTEIRYEHVPAIVGQQQQQVHYQIVMPAQPTVQPANMVIQTVPQTSQPTQPPQQISGFSPSTATPLPVQYQPVQQQETVITNTPSITNVTFAPTSVAKSKGNKGKAKAKPSAATVSQSETDTTVTFIQEPEKQTAEPAEEFRVTPEGKVVKSGKPKKTMRPVQDFELDDDGNVLLKVKPVRETGPYKMHQKMTQERRKAIQAGINEVINKKSYKIGQTQKKGVNLLKTNESFLTGCDNFKLKFGEHGYPERRITKQTETRTAIKATPVPSPAPPPKKLVPISFEEMQKMMGKTAPIKLKPANVKIMPMAKPAVTASVSSADAKKS